MTKAHETPPKDVGSVPAKATAKLSMTVVAPAAAQKALTPDTANGLFSVLLERFGPILGEMILKWIMSRDRVVHAGRGLMDGNVLRGWLATVLRDNKDEILIFITGQLSGAYDGVVTVIEGTA